MDAPEPSDLHLLDRYARHGDEAAFAEVVRRHLNLVHAAALRQVRSPQLAEEAASTAFQELARSAPRLAPGTVVPAWLYAVTRGIALNTLRGEARRRLRERAAHELATMNATAADWNAIAPRLDDAMQALDEADRAALLLRYFENQPLREVGVALGTGEDAAQKRVSRAVGCLRDWFAQRGVKVGAGGLGAVISANAVQAAPAGLAAAVTGSAIAATAVGSGATLTFLTIMKTKTLVVCAIVLLVGAGIILQQKWTSSSKAKTIAHITPRPNADTTGSAINHPAASDPTSSELPSPTNNRGSSTQPSNLYAYLTEAEVLRLAALPNGNRSNDPNAQAARISGAIAQAAWVVDYAYTNFFPTLNLSETDLQSLKVLLMHRGDIAKIEASALPSELPLEQRLASIRIPIDEQIQLLLVDSNYQAFQIHQADLDINLQPGMRSYRNLPLGPQLEYSNPFPGAVKFTPAGEN